MGRSGAPERGTDVDGDVDGGRPRRTYLDFRSAIRAADADSAALWVPPEADVLRPRHDPVEAAHDVLKRHRLLHLAQPERGLERELHGHDEARAAHARERREEERAALGARAGDELAAREQHRERDHVAREHLELEPGAVRRGREDAAEGLRRDRAEVVHREPVRRELPLQVDERDPGLCDHAAFLDVHLRAVRGGRGRDARGHALHGACSSGGCAA